jgi:CRISPR-associated protein Csd1
LLAIADRAENNTYERGEKRQTNAKRYWSRFARRPADTWETIRNNLVPYLEKMTPGLKNWYESLIADVSSKIPAGEYDNTPLNYLYLLGYDSQFTDLFKKKENEE